MRRTVVVTGGAKGIGRAVVERFAELGDRVVAIGRDEDALAALRNDLDGIELASGDVTNERWVDECFARVGDVDVLVNNAGVAESAPLHRTTLQSWERQIAVNATGVFLCTRAVIEPMRKRGNGAIVTVASTAGRIGTSYTCAYTASKHAAIGVMRTAAAELAGTGATANTVCPTFVDSDMSRRTVARIVKATGRSEDAARAALAETAPLGRLLRTDEVASAVAWLASDAATSVNGQLLVLDGGGVQL